MLRTRLWTALIGLPAVAAAILFLPSGAFTLLIALLLVWGLCEVAAMVGAASLKSATPLVVVGLLAAALVGLAPVRFWMLWPAILLAMGLLAAHVWLGNGLGLSHDTLGLLGALWTGGLFPYFALVRNPPGGIALLLETMLLVMASDTGAYFCGLSLGKTKLAPKISPNKTVAGAVGGFVSALVAGFVLTPMLRADLGGVFSTLFFSAMVGVLAQAGDLAGSAFKRAAGVKDSGWILPGHGGLLDRTSSLVFAAAFAYYYAR